MAFCLHWQHVQMLLPCGLLQAALHASKSSLFVNNADTLMPQTKTSCTLQRTERYDSYGMRTQLLLSASTSAMASMSLQQLLYRLSTTV